MDNISRSKSEIRKIVTMTRLDLYNSGVPCGSKVILKKMNEYNVKPLPSERTILRILASQGLTHQRTGWYPGEEING